MWKNYLKTLLAGLLDNRLYSLINIAGLALGLAACLLIALFVRGELGYDAQFPAAERIYRLSPDFRAGPMGPERHPAGNVAPLAPLLRQALPAGVEQVARIGGQHALVSREEQAFYEENLRWADPELFEIFRLDWLRGDPETVIDAPFSIAISESLARKYFGAVDVLGQSLELENTWTVTVNGVFADLPENSHLGADLIVSMDTAWALLDFDYGNNWSYTNFHTYLLLEPGRAIEPVVEEIRSLVQNSVDPELSRFFGLADGGLDFTPYALRDIHLFSGRRGEFREPGSPAFVVTFALVALGLLLIACINFMNLNTARSSQRAREIGLRKTLGASRAELVRQFLGESLCMALLAWVLALLLVEPLLPVFAGLMNRNPASMSWYQPSFLLGSLLGAAVTGLLAGSYPAFYLSRFRPASVLKEDGGGTFRGTALRNLLVVLQFSLSIVLIVATAVVTLQMRYARNLDLGFDKERVLVLWGTHQDGLGEQWPVLKQNLLQHSGIGQVTEGDMYPGSVESRQVRIEGGNPNGFDMLGKRIGFGFFDTYGIGLVAGRDFDEALATDRFVPPPNVAEGERPRGAFVLNETAVRELGLSPEQALGLNFDVDFSSDFSLAVSGPVIGVVEDVHIQSIRQPIRPLFYYVPTVRWGGLPSMDVASVRIEGGRTEATVDYIRAAWRRLMPELPLIHHFLQTDYDLLYQQEERQGQLFSLFALLMVTIACLGLFGLATFTVERRRKEIGVRKVLGGSVLRIVMLLTNDFSKLVLIANVVAWPVAYVAMQRWLDNFAYRIDLTPLIFIGSGLIALCVAWVTVGGTAAKAASRKPVLALRYE